MTKTGQPKVRLVTRVDAVIPPLAGVTLVECRDRLELQPYYWCREFVGLGRFSSSEVGPKPGHRLHAIFAAVNKGRDIWVVTSWRRHEDGSEEELQTHYLDPEATEADARKAFDGMVSFQNHTRKELEELSSLFKASEDDLAYVESTFPEPSAVPAEGASIQERDLYQARLKVLAGMQPKTVELIHRADTKKDPALRHQIEAIAVQAYFADLAHYWTETQARVWQKKNPVGTEWMLYFAEVRSKPKLEVDPVNHALVLDWLRKKYDLLTAQELSDAIFDVTGDRIKPDTLKKRRERLGLTTKRPTGPRPNSDQ